MNYSSQSVDEEGGTDESIYVLPLIVLFGLSGNIISLVTIFHSRLRHVSANVYLIVLTAADSVFLTGVLLVCFKVDFVAYEYCVALEYVLMTASYISSWSTCALTIERYLAIAHPLRNVRYGHIDRVKMMVYWLPLPFILHLFQFVNLVPSTVDGERKCVLRAESYQLVAESLDVVLCYGIPCLIVVVLNVLVALKLNIAKKDFEGAKPGSGSRRQGGQQSSSGHTRILWVVPLVFVVLNTPFYLTIIINVFSTVLFESDQELSPFAKTVYNLAHYLYYLNFASDVIVYAFSSANFRKTAVIAWRRILCPRYGSKKSTKIGNDRSGGFSYHLTSMGEGRAEVRKHQLNAPLAPIQGAILSSI